MTSPIERLSNWEALWTGFIREQRKKPLIWGQEDCMLLAGRNVEVITGLDFYSSHIGKYSSEEEAFEYLSSLGHSSPGEMIAGFLPEQALAFSQRGDIVSLNDCLGVCVGGQVMFKDDAHVAFVPLLDCDQSWRVG